MKRWWQAASQAQQALLTVAVVGVLAGIAILVVVVLDGGSALAWMGIILGVASLAIFAVTMRAQWKHSDPDSGHQRPSGDDSGT